MTDRQEKGAQPLNNAVQNNRKAASQEKEIEIRQQFQMFPTPDETFAANEITELKD